MRALQDDDSRVGVHEAPPQILVSVHKRVRRWRGPEWGKGLRTSRGYVLNGPLRRLALLLYGEEACYGTWDDLPDVSEVTLEDLLTNAGRDLGHNAWLQSAGQPAGLQFLAITQNAVAPAATDTTLTGEETLNGLARAIGTYAHTAGTNTSTLVKTWTYTGAPAITLNKYGSFNAAAAGTMGWESLLAPAPTLNTNDQLQLTITFTIG